MTLNNGLYMISLEAWQIAAMGETLEQFFFYFKSPKGHLAFCTHTSITKVISLVYLLGY